MGEIFFGARRFDAKLVAFDKDGTLFDFGASWRPAFLKALDSLLAPFPQPAALRRALCRALGYDAGSGAFSEHGPFATATGEAIIHAAATALVQESAIRLTRHECERLVRDRFAPVVAEWAALAPAADLARLFGGLRESGVRIALITSDDSGPTKAALDRQGLAPLVDFVACGDGPFRHKPAPDALLGASKALGVPLRQAAMVGDTAVDLQMAQAAGAGLAVGVLTGVGSRETLAPFADVVLASIAEIRAEPIRRRS